MLIRLRNGVYWVTTTLTLALIPNNHPWSSPSSNHPRVIMSPNSLPLREGNWMARSSFGSAPGSPCTAVRRQWARLTPTKRCTNNGRKNRANKYLPEARTMCPRQGHASHVSGMLIAIFTPLSPRKELAPRLHGSKGTLLRQAQLPFCGAPLAGRSPQIQGKNEKHT